MEVIVIETEAFKALQKKMMEEMYTYLQSREKNLNIPEHEWLPLNEAQKILGIVSRRKWKELRDNGDLDFSKVGKNFLYHKPSLLLYIKKHSTLPKLRLK